MGFKIESVYLEFGVLDASALFIVTTAGWVGVVLWRIDMEAPRDEPIRFNRVRRKVYVYQFHYSWLRPFCRNSWGIKAVAYDWDSLKAEFCSIYGPMGTGGLIQFVNLAVVDAQGEKIVDRFLYARGRQSGEMYWAMAQLYMQEGPSAVPKFEKLPRDWNNETHFENIARRFAPRVQWPEEMDLESRSAPDASSQSSSEETTPDSHAGHNQGKAALQKVKSIDDRG
ncbi:DUF6708 domain-containing protein [Pseudomonas sp. HR96]|uniref:DUF6708 domain-containing protein n=1 Tax=Pseudomonas sp. HR96 TaxID=1027966 RepID=UPI002A7640D2|nr:DUF6708 domain-containing protein [Pseudomonas sp. HR96]WPP01494.1 DUF6708 domain-containing protein [Pseudomonas sp. HR96]